MRSRPPSGTKIANLKVFLQHFADTFVEPTFRERFIHEATKKPQRLTARICHSIEEIFSSSYSHGRPPFGPDDLCIPISGTDCNFQQLCWSELATYVDRGNGILIASADANRFYAETETEHGSPHKAYCGSIHKHQKPNKPAPHL